MAMRFPQSATVNGIAVNLGTEDSVYVASNVFVASEVNYAIVGYGSHHRATVYGNVSGVNGIVLGDSDSDTRNQIEIHEGARIFCTGLAIGTRGTSGRIVNHGEILNSEYGISVIGTKAANPTTQSVIINTGTVVANADAIVRDSFETTETIVLNNSGTITGTNAYGYYGGINHIAIDRITNTGAMNGNIYLLGADDIYDGRKGRFDGDLFAGVGNDTILLGKDNDTAYGEAGNDRLEGGAGKDYLNGDSGRDILIGGKGGDTLVGGGDGDVFVFTALSDSTVGKNGRDRISDFTRSQNDKIDLSGIDANTAISGDQTFAFIGAKGFSKKAGELRIENTSDGSVLYGDVNGDGKADFSIGFETNLALKAADFLL